jgi:hypothetical protein
LEPSETALDFEPNDLLQLNMGRPRTWRILAQVAARSTDRRMWNDLFEDPMGGVGLGAITYRSSEAPIPPSRRPWAYRPRLHDSTSWPRRSSRACAQARPKLLLDGFGGSRWKEWWRLDERLIQAFVGRPDPIRFTWERKVGAQSIEFLEADGRRVIYSRALNGAIPRKYKELLIGLASTRSHAE